MSDCRYKLKDLEVDGIYRDTLSGQLVQVIDVGNLCAKAHWFNPITGTHELIDVHERQLESATYPSHYQPRT